MDETTLIESLKKGNHHALVLLMNQYQNMVFSICLKICEDYFLAEEAAQDTFIKVYNQIHRFKQEAKFSTWVYRIAVNTSFTKTKQKKSAFLDLSDAEIIPSDFEADQLSQLIKEEQQQKIKSAIDSLPALEALAISLYYLEDYSVKEVSEALNISLENTKVKLFRARKKLKEIL